MYETKEVHNSRRKNSRATSVGNCATDTRVYGYFREIKEFKFEIKSRYIRPVLYHSMIVRVLGR